MESRGGFFCDLDSCETAPSLANCGLGFQVFYSFSKAYAIATPRIAGGLLLPRYRMALQWLVDKFACPQRCAIKWLP
ncbi:hypothetical protein K239x_09610 [Planctomycetes bacterium K23_9]|uniref:Uncharacterized protein n=1 Tax=Stieleria marina TaxID=1930275 RepID=A0A517NPH4_9BACT|nr:hypothetical protein K239x_09610 [Planctomycetes bacterium K23_9]